MARNSDFFDRLLERYDQLDAASMQGYLIKLVRERGLLDTIFKTIREGVLIIDRDLNIHFVNQAAMDLLGLPADIRERDDPRLSRYLRGIDWEQLMDQDAEEWDKATRQEIEVLYPRHRHLMFYMLPYKDQALGVDRHENLVAIILQDITDLRETTETTIESEKLNAITMLAAGVAHEIGNPLNSLMIHLQLLQRHFKKLSNQEPHLDAINLVDVAMSEVNRLDTIINQFLKAIRPSPLDLAPLTVTELISDTLAILKAEIENRGITVEGEWTGKIPSVLGDASQLKQVFYNLFNNALQAMPEGGFLRIIVTPTDTHLAVHIIDTGKGISPEDLGNIFNPYYTTRTQGTGLGLVIVERIIREHGGDLSVESEVGQGTTMTVTLPLEVRSTRLLQQGSPNNPSTS